MLLEAGSDAPLVAFRPAVGARMKDEDVSIGDRLSYQKAQAPDECMENGVGSTKYSTVKSTIIPNSYLLNMYRITYKAIIRENKMHTT